MPDSGVRLLVVAALLAGVRWRRRRRDGSGTPPPAATPLACADLHGMAIPAASIGLPTGGAGRHRGVGRGGVGHRARAQSPSTASSARRSRRSTPPRPRSGSGSRCPTTWNSKAVMFGGGGFDGTIPNVAGNVPARPDRPAAAARARLRRSSPAIRATRPAPWARWTAPSSQRRGAAQLGRRGAQEDPRRRRLPDQGPLRRRRDQKSYFAGGSTGGREALESIHALAGRLGRRRRLVPGVEPGVGDPRRPPRQSRPGPARRLSGVGGQAASCSHAAMQACDGLDGVMDGLINNQLRCNAIFDPSTASVERQPAALPGRRRHRRHLPVGCTDHRPEDDQHRRPVPLRAGQRRDQLSRATTSGAPTSASPRSRAAAADRDLPRPRHLAAGVPDAARAPYISARSTR